MKKIVLYFVVFITLISCDNKKEVIEQKHKDGLPKVVSVYNNDKIQKQTKFYQNGQMEITGEFNADGKRQGHWQYWYENGNLWSECDYNNGIRNGMNTVYYENGVKRFEGEYKQDKKVGKWLFWNEDGTLAVEKDM